MRYTNETWQVCVAGGDMSSAEIRHEICGSDMAKYNILHI